MHNYELRYRKSCLHDRLKFVAVRENCAAVKVKSTIYWTRSLSWFWTSSDSSTAPFAMLFKDSGSRLTRCCVDSGETWMYFSQKKKFHCPLFYRALHQRNLNSVWKTVRSKQGSLWVISGWPQGGGFFINKTQESKIINSPWKKVFQSDKNPKFPFRRLFNNIKLKYGEFLETAKCENSTGINLGKQTTAFSYFDDFIEYAKTYVKGMLVHILISIKLPKHPSKVWNTSGISGKYWGRASHSISRMSCVETVTL